MYNLKTTILQRNQEINQVFAEKTETLFLFAYLICYFMGKVPTSTLFVARLDAEKTAILFFLLI